MDEAGARSERGRPVHGLETLVDGDDHRVMRYPREERNPTGLIRLDCFRQQCVHAYMRVPIQAREKKKRHGKTGSARRFSSLTIRSLITNRIHSRTETTNNEIDVPELQANEVPASKRTVTSNRVAPSKEKVPNPSNRANEADENLCRNVGAMYDALP